LGGVKIGNGLSVDGAGVITVTGSLTSGASTASSVLATVGTADATQTTVASFVMADNTAILFSANVVCKSSTGSAAGGFTLSGVLHRGTGAASTAFTGLEMKSIVARDVAGWDCDAFANTTTGGLDIKVTGAAATTLSWFADIQVTSVG
jgi:hypothetical protein